MYIYDYLCTSMYIDRADRVLPGISVSSVVDVGQKKADSHCVPVRLNRHAKTKFGF